jgi:hypothetical protein
MNDQNFPATHEADQLKTPEKRAWGLDLSKVEEFRGPLEPTETCNGWNSKRQKYCHARAGMGTDHPRVGRCKFHNGANITHGNRRKGYLQRLCSPALLKKITSSVKSPETRKAILDMIDFDIMQARAGE